MVSKGRGAKERWRRGLRARGGSKNDLGLEPDMHYYRVGVRYRGDLAGTLPVGRGQSPTMLLPNPARRPRFPDALGVIAGGTLVGALEEYI